MPFITSSGRLELLSNDAGPERPTPTLVEATVLAHHHVADRYWRLRLRAPRIASTAQPGQFVMLTVAHAQESTPVLPRPMAVYTTDTSDGSFEVMYGVVGAGTNRLTRIETGAKITTVGPLGQCFTLNPTTRRILLLGRGIGTCSLTALAFAAQTKAIEVIAVDSARTAHALIADDTYYEAGVGHLLQVVDADGTSQPSRVRSTLLDLAGQGPPQQIYTCGSRRLARMAGDMAGRWGAEVQVSLEAHMACGLGYCHGCASGTQTADNESPLICRDGPVFRLTTEEATPAPTP